MQQEVSSKFRDHLEKTPQGLRSRLQQFQSSLPQNWSAERVFREKNSPGNVFEDKNSVEDGVEYWKVSTPEGDYLVPQPQTTGFRETRFSDGREVSKAREISFTGPSGSVIAQPFGEGQVKPQSGREIRRDANKTSTPDEAVANGASEANSFGGASPNDQAEDVALKETTAYLTAARELLNRRDREKKDLEVQFEQEVTRLYVDRQKAESALLENRRKFGDDAARRMLTKPEIYFDGPEDDTQKFANPGRRDEQVGDQELKRASELKRELEKIGDEQRTLRELISEIKDAVPDKDLKDAPRPTSEEFNAALSRVEEHVAENNPAVRAQRILDLAAERQSAEEIQSDREALKEVTALAGDTLKEQAEQARKDFQTSREALKRHFSSIYENASKATERFRSRLETEGFREAITTLTENPDAYGTLSRNVDEEGLSWASKTYIEDQEASPTAAEAYLNAPGGREGGEVKTAAEFALRWSKRVELDTQNLMERQQKTRSEVYRKGSSRTRQAMDRAADVLGKAKREYDRLSMQLMDNPQDNYESELDEQLGEAAEGVWEELQNKVQNLEGWTTQKTTGSRGGNAQAQSRQESKTGGANRGPQDQGTTQTQGGQNKGSGHTQQGQQTTTGPNTQGGTKSQSGPQGPSGAPAGASSTGGMPGASKNQQGGSAGTGQRTSPQMKAQGRSLAMTVKRREQSLQTFLNKIYESPTDAQIRIEQNAFKDGLSTKTSAFKNTQVVIQDDLRWFGKTNDQAIRQLKYNDTAETKDKGRRTWRWGRLGAEIAEGVVERGPDEPTEEALKKVRTAAKGTGFLVAGAAAYGVMTAKDKTKKAWRTRQARKKAKSELNKRLKNYGNALERYQSHLNNPTGQSSSQSPGGQGQGPGGQGQGPGGQGQGPGGQGWRRPRPTGPVGAQTGTGPQNGGQGQAPGGGGSSKTTGSESSGRGETSTERSPGSNSAGSNSSSSNTESSTSSTSNPSNSSSPKAGAGRSRSTNKNPSGEGKPEKTSSGEGPSRGGTSEASSPRRGASGGKTAGSTPNATPESSRAGDSRPKSKEESPISDVKEKATKEAIRGRKAVESDHVSLGGQPVWFSERSSRSGGQTTAEKASAKQATKSASTGRSESASRGASQSGGRSL